MGKKRYSWLPRIIPNISQIFGRGSSRAMEVDDSNAPVVPVVARVDTVIPSADIDLNVEMQSDSSLHAPVGDVSIEVDMQDEQPAQASVENDEPKIIKDSIKVDFAEIDKELQRCHSGGLRLSLPKEVEEKLCKKSEKKCHYSHARHVEPGSVERMIIDREIEKNTQKYHGNSKLEKKAASKLGFDDTPLDFLERAAKLLESCPEQGDENFKNENFKLYKNFIQSSKQSIDKKSDCSRESLKTEAQEHVHLLLTNKDKIKILRFQSNTRTWRGGWCDPELVKPIFNNFYDYIQSDNSAAIDAKNLSGMDFEGVASDLFNVKAPGTCGTGGKSPIEFLQDEIGFQYTAGSVYCHFQYGPKTITIGFELETQEFKDVKIPAIYSATGEEQVVWGSFYKPIKDLQVPYVIKQFIGNLDNMWTNFDFVFAGANENKTSVLELFKFTPAEQSKSKRNFVHTQSVLKVSIVESNSVKSGIAMLSCNFLGMKALKGTTSTHPNRKFQPSINTPINEAVYLYDELDRKVPVATIDLAEGHSAGLEMRKKPEITPWLLANSKYWTRARQFASRGSAAPWNNYKSLEECLNNYLASNQQNQNEAVLVQSSSVGNTGADRVQFQILPKSRKKMSKAAKKADQQRKRLTKFEHIDWQDRRTLMETPIPNLENINRRLNNSDDFKLKLSYLSENSIEMSQMIEQQLEMAILEQGEGATGAVAFHTLGTNHKADTNLYYDGHLLADLVYAACNVLIPSGVKEEIVDADVIDHDDLPNDSIEEIIISPEVSAFNYLKSFFSQQGFDELAKEIGFPHDNDQLAIRNMLEWISIVEIFNTNFSEHTSELFGKDVLTVKDLFDLLFRNWPDIDIPKNKVFIEFLRSKVASKSKPAHNIIDKLFNPSILMDEKVVKKMRDSKFPDYRPNLHKTYTNIEEDHVKGYSKDNKPSNDTETIRYFTSRGYLMLSPYHIWKKLKQLSSFNEHYENRAKQDGSKKRSLELQNQKARIRSKCAKLSDEDKHFNRARRGDLIEGLYASGDIEKKEYDRLQHFNREPEKITELSPKGVTWKCLRDLAHATDKYVVLHHKSTWPLKKQDYLSQPKTIRDYKRFNLKASNIMLRDTIDPQRARTVLGLRELDDAYLHNI